MSSPRQLASEVITALRDPRPDPDGAPRRPGHRAPPALAPAVPVPAGPAAQLSLLDVLRRRRSERVYGPGTVPAEEVAGIVRLALEADRASWPDTQAFLPLQVFAIAFRVGGLEPGMYALPPAADGYELLAPLPPPAELAGFTLQAEFGRAAVILSVAVDLAEAETRHGAHGYRTSLTRSGAAAYAMWLHGVGRGRVGSVFAGFIPAMVRTPLCSDGTSRHQVFALALGSAPPARPGGESSARTLHH